MIDGWRLANGLDMRKLRVAARRRRGRLRGAAERHDRRRRAVPEVGQRDRAARLVARRALQRRAGERRRRGGRRAGLPEGAIALVAGGGREELAELATQDGVVDLIIPRGGEGLKAALQGGRDGPGDLRRFGQLPRLRRRERRPRGGARDHPQRQAPAPGRLQRRRDAAGPRDVAGAFLPERCGAGRRRRRAARRRAARGRRAGRRGRRRRPTHDWDTEYLALELAVGVVDSAEEAIAHVNAHGSGHSEAIVTARHRSGARVPARRRRRLRVRNASTRFTDGGEFGMGAEIGNSTQKLHARGPIGLRELCTFKYLVEGDGHVRAVTAHSLNSRCASASSAGRSTRRISVISSAPRRRTLQLELDRVMLMPAAIPPHKPVDDEPGADAPPGPMPRWRSPATRDASRCPTWRSRRTGTSYTVDTLQQLHSRAPDSELTSDRRRRHRRGSAQWREPERVLSLARLAVAERPGTSARGRAGAGELPGAERVAFFDMPRIGVSSTMLRSRVRDGQPIRYLTPDAVAGYIDRHQPLPGGAER